MKMKIRHLPWLVAGAYAASHPAHAQLVVAQATLPPVTVTAPADTGYDTPAATSATTVAIPLRDVPQVVNVVPLTVLRDQNALSLQDALQNVPGLSFSVGDGQRDQVTIRGFSAITDQFIDGVRDDALYYRDLSNIERIEVLKGPASVLYGRGSAGGIVNRITKKPRAQPQREVGATIGSEGQRRTEFDFGTANADKTVLLRVAGAVEDSKGFRQQYFLQREAIAPSITWKLGAQTSLTAQADYLRDKRLADQGVPSFRGKPVNVPMETYYGAANGRDRAFVQSEVSSGTLTLDHAFSDALKFHSVLRGYDFQLDRNYTTIARVTEGKTPGVTISQTRRLRDERGHYWQNELTQKGQWGGMQHQLLYGVELGRQTKSELLRSRANVATYDLFRPVLATLAPLPSSLAASTDVANLVDITAGYVQDHVTFNPRWKLLAGLRYERLEQVRDDRTARNQDLRRVDRPLSPRAGLVYQPDDRWSMYAAFSRSFQPLADSFSFRANSDQLKPTETENREIGVKYDFDRASVSAALFDMSQSNIQVQDPANALFSLPVGKQRTRGLEVSASGEIAPRWELIGGYSLMRGRITDSTERTSAGTPFAGNTAALTPRHTFAVWVKRRLERGFWVGIGGRAESSRFASPDNLTALPGYGVVHAGVGYDTDKFSVTVTLKNLLDRKYFVSAHSGANDYNMPGEPRSLLVAARYRF